VSSDGSEGGAADRVRIRPVTVADTDAILALWRVVFPEYTDPAAPQRDPRPAIERKLAFGDGRFAGNAGALAFWASLGFGADAVLSLGKRL